MLRVNVKRLFCLEKNKKHYSCCVYYLYCHYFYVIAIVSFDSYPKQIIPAKEL